MKKEIGIAGAGFAGAVLARELAESGRFTVTVFEKRDHVGGNCHTYRDEETGILIHKFSPHIFNTNREDIWNYVNKWGRFEPYIHRVKAVTREGVFPLPINLLTINQFFKKKMGPREARDFIGSLSDSSTSEAKNFEDQAHKFLGKDLYENFLQGYTRKLWAIEPSRLPASLLSRLPVRFNYEDHYYEQKYQGIPISGYTEIIRRLLDHHSIDLKLGQGMQPQDQNTFDHIFWSAPLDGYFDYSLGRLGYRTIKYEKLTDHGDYQGSAVMNYCEEEVPFTRITEHKHLAPWEDHDKTVVFKEYSENSQEGDVPSYPLGQEDDRMLFEKYHQLALQEEKVTFIGRLGTYRYLDMHMVISESLDLAKSCLVRDLEDWPKFSNRSL